MSDFIPFTSGRGYDNRRNQGRRWRGGGHGGRHRGRGRRGPGRGGGFESSNRSEIEEINAPSDTSLCVAVEGCCHGELDAIYSRIEGYEKKSGRKVDLLLCCGDFQAIRHPVDYNSLAVPPKYRRLGSFHRYYSGEKKVPVLTIFVGGNHEASQPLQELYYGGWVAPGIYYMGAAGVVNVGGIRIAGISGIFNRWHYRQGHFERPPYDKSTLRSVYHVRNLEIYRLKCLMQSTGDERRRRLDIMLSHDWPQGIESHGNTGALLKRKPYFRAEVETNSLGSPPLFELLQSLQPRRWFAAHLHVYFKARMNHQQGRLTGSCESKSEPSVISSLVPSQVKVGKTSLAQNEADASFKSKVTTDDELICLPVAQEETSNEIKDIQKDDSDISTEFLSLDKCLPGKKFLSIVYVPTPDQKRPEIVRLEYDVEWLAILRRTNHFAEPTPKTWEMEDFVSISNDEMSFIVDQVGHDGNLEIPNNFVPTIPHATDPDASSVLPSVLPMMGNPQTDDLLTKLGISHALTIPYGGNYLPTKQGERHEDDENEINLDSDEEGEVNANHMSENQDDRQGIDDNEINLDTEDEEENIATQSQHNSSKISDTGVLDENEIDIDCGSKESDQGGTVEDEATRKRPRLD